MGAPHADLIARVLDWGAHGIMVPHVNSAAEAGAVVQAAHYPPRGRRGFSRTVRRMITDSAFPKAPLRLC